MSDDGGVEEWDQDFLDQLVELEERALSSNRNPTHDHHNQRQTAPPVAAPPPQPSVSNATTNYYSYNKPQQQQQQQQQEQQIFTSYSPPRELSQRPSTSVNVSNDSGVTTLEKRSLNAVAKCGPSVATVASRPPRRGRSVADDAKEQEIERLKRELECVSNQLIELEQECSELRKERYQKVEQIELVYPPNEERDAVADHHHKSTNCSREHAISTAECHEVSRKFQNAKASEHQAQPQMDVAASSHKAIGVQTPSVSDCTNIAFSDDLLNCLGLSEKLRSIWSTPSNQKLGRTVISRLLVACAADFHVLFGCMSMNVSSKVILNSLAGESPSHVDWQFNMHSFHSLEAAKVSHLYSVLAKIGNGMLPLETLFEPLLDLCSLGNVVIIHRSLHILHLFLKHLLTLERNSWRRDNVMVEGDCFRSNDEEFYGNESIKTEGLFCANRGETSHAGHLPFDIRSDAGNKRARLNPGCAVLVSCIDWVSLFDLMCQVAVRSTEKNVKFEAVSIMNIIVLRSNAHLERERFGQARVFESISQLLKKEASLHVRKKALHLLHLLLNCPKLLVTFCSGCNKADSASAANDDEPNSKRFTIILEGLAECLAGCGNGVQGLELQRNAIVLLAFLASFGKSGFDILVSHKLPQESNFLMLILQVIVSEMETEPAACTESTEILKARTLLVREALILLNRLVSHPSYSGTVLQLLTNSRDMATLTIDIANSLTWKGQRLKQSGSLARHMKDTDIFDLARGFKKRVFSYFGGTIS